MEEEYLWGFLYFLPIILGLYISKKYANEHKKRVEELEKRKSELRADIGYFTKEIDEKEYFLPMFKSCKTKKQYFQAREDWNEYIKNLELEGIEEDTLPQNEWSSDDTFGCLGIIAYVAFWIFTIWLGVSAFGWGGFAVFLLWGPLGLVIYTLGKRS